MSWWCLRTSNEALLDGLVIDEAGDAHLVHGETLPRPRVLGDLRLFPRATADDEHQHQGADDQADLSTGRAINTEEVKLLLSSRWQLYNYQTRLQY